MFFITELTDRLSEETNYKKTSLQLSDYDRTALRAFTRNRSGLGGDPNLLHPARVRPIISVAHIIRPVSPCVRFRLRKSTAQESKPITIVLEIPVLVSGLGDRFQVVQRASWPERCDLAGGAVRFVPRLTTIPDSRFQELVFECDEVLDGRRLGRETMDILRLPTIHHLEDVIGLCLCKI
jgi:hypothetical protein